MSKLIKNNDFIRNKIEECIELRLDEINDLFEVSLNEDYLSIDFIKQLKNIWNKHNKEPKLYIHQLLSTTELYLPCLEKAVRVIYFRFLKIIFIFYKFLFPKRIQY